MVRPAWRRFADRADAGQQLAERLNRSKPYRPIVYALPRGGVAMAAEIAVAFIGVDDRAITAACKQALVRIERRRHLSVSGGPRLDPPGRASRW